MMSRPESRNATGLNGTQSLSTSLQILIAVQTYASCRRERVRRHLLTGRTYQCARRIVPLKSLNRRPRSWDIKFPITISVDSPPSLASIIIYRTLSALAFGIITSDRDPSLVLYSSWSGASNRIFRIVICGRRI